jgi:hypothetical protein
MSDNRLQGNQPEMAKGLHLLLLTADTWLASVGASLRPLLPLLPLLHSGLLSGSTHPAWPPPTCRLRASRSPVRLRVDQRLALHTCRRKAGRHGEPGVDSHRGRHLAA